MPGTNYGSPRDSQYRAALKLEDWYQNPLGAPLAPQPTFMPGVGGVYEYNADILPAIVRGKPFPLILRGFTVDEVDNILRGQDRIYAGPGQVPQYDWQAALPPKGRVPALENKSFNYNEMTNYLTGEDAFPPGMQSMIFVTVTM